MHLHAQQIIRHFHLRTFLAVAGSLGLLSSAACKDRDADRADASGAVAPATEDTTDEDEKALASDRELDDADIEAAVSRELLLDRSTPKREIAVNSEDGIVELTGSVDQLLAKRRAELIAERIKGVRSVSNRITLEPSATVDDETLAEDVRKALLYDPAAESYELEVAVKDGVVTLSGTVDSWAERQLAERVAASIRGVREIENEVIVSYAEADARPDAEIEAEVRSRLQWDVLVDHENIDVKVEDGEVVLSGAVGSAAERRRAATDAWTAGVEEVDTSGLEIVWYAEDPNFRRPHFEIESPKAIHDAIVEAAALDPRVYSFNIHPEVTGSTVTLKGSVDNLEAKRAAEQLARNTVGVTQVVNEIQVEADDQPTDAKIEDLIQARLATNVYTNPYEVQIEAKGGVVTLTGKVDAYLEKAEAESVAAETTGVVAVVNRIEVEDPELGYVYDPYLYPFAPNVQTWSDYTPPATQIEDMKLEDEIEFQLYWSPFVDEEQVQVNVLNGRATLTGTVDSLREKTAATDNAYEAGATHVANELKVEV